MAYKPTNKQTLKNTENQKFLNLFQKQQKKSAKIISELYTLICRTYDEIYLSDDEFIEKLSELVGTKRYKGKNIQLGLQVKILRKFNELKHFITTRKENKNEQNQRKIQKSSRKPRKQPNQTSNP